MANSPSDIIKHIALAGAAPYIGTERAEKLAATIGPQAHTYSGKEWVHYVATPRELVELSLDREYVEGVASAFQLLVDRIEAARPHLKSDQAIRCLRDLDEMLVDVKADTSLAYVAELVGETL